MEFFRSDVWSSRYIFAIHERGSIVVFMYGGSGVGGNEGVFRGCRFEA
jgi:hypothetical protein